MTTFLGSYEFQMDEKGRVSLPSAFRRGVEDPRFVLLQWKAPALTLFPVAAWAQTQERLLQFRRNQPEAWSEVLKTKDIGVYENLASWGGGAVDRMKVAGMAIEHRCHLTPELVEAHPSIAEMAEGRLSFWPALWEMMEAPDPARESATFAAMVRQGTVAVPTLKFEGKRVSILENPRRMRHR